MTDEDTVRGGEHGGDIRIDPADLAALVDGSSHLYECVFTDADRNELIHGASERAREHLRSVPVSSEWWVAEGAERLREARMDAGIGVSDLSDMAGIDSSSVSVYERGRQVPPLGRLERMVDALEPELNHHQYPYDEGVGIHLIYDP